MVKFKKDIKPSLRYNAVIFIAGKTGICGFKSYEGVKKRIERIEKRGETRYRPPRGMKFRTEISKEVFGGMDYYIFDGGKSRTGIFFHGGALIAPPTPFHLRAADRLASDCHAKIYFPIYPRLPFYNAEKCHGILTDWIKSLPEKEFFFIGDSAGGGLALSLYDCLLKNGDKIPGRIVAFSPWVDVSMTNMDVYFGECSDKLINARAMCAFYPFWKGNFKADNPMCSALNCRSFGETEILIISGGAEALTKDIKRFCARHSEDKIIWLEYGNLQHDFPVFPVKERNDPLMKTVDFLNFGYFDLSGWKKENI